MHNSGDIVATNVVIVGCGTSLKRGTTHMTTHHQLQTDASENASHTVERTYFTIFFFCFFHLKHKSLTLDMSGEIPNKACDIETAVKKSPTYGEDGFLHFARRNLYFQAFLLHRGVFSTSTTRCRGARCARFLFFQLNVPRKFIASHLFSEGILALRKWCEGLVDQVFGPASKQCQQELISDNLGNSRFRG